MGNVIHLCGNGAANMGAQMERQWVEIQYVCSRGGSGSTRMYLDQLPDWLEMPLDHEGNRMVHSIKII